MQVLDLRVDSLAGGIDSALTAALATVRRCARLNA